MRLCKCIISVLFFLTNLKAQSSLKWSSDNGCVYNLDDPAYIMSETGSWTFEILKKENNIYYYRLFNDVSMHIRCPNISAYCDKSDSLYKKAWETLEDEHDCRSLSYFRQKSAVPPSHLLPFVNLQVQPQSACPAVPH